MLTVSQLSNPNARWVVLEDDIVPIKRGEFESFFDATDYIDEHESECKGYLYIVQPVDVVYD